MCFMYGGADNDLCDNVSKKSYNLNIRQKICLQKNKKFQNITCYDIYLGKYNAK